MAKKNKKQYIPWTETIESLSKFDLKRKLKLTTKQAWAIAEWHEKNLAVPNGGKEPELDPLVARLHKLAQGELDEK